MKEVSTELKQKFKQVKLLALDVDGVMTDGGVYIADDGREFRRFNIKDGLGLKRVMDSGILVAVISSSTNQAVLHRCRLLGISEVHTNIEDKLVCLEEICKRYSIKLFDCCYMGDDLVDLPTLKKVGLSCAPSDAIDLVVNTVNYVCELRGGEGCVREVCDRLSYDR